MKLISDYKKIILSLAFLVMLTACSDREDGPSEIVNARPVSPYYFVKKGETLGDVAAKHSMKEDELISLNNLKPPYTLFERQRILVRVLGKNTDYAKPGGDITVKELDEEPKKDEENKDGAVDRMSSSSEGDFGDVGATDAADSSASSSSSAGKNAALTEKGSAAKSASSTKAKAAPVSYDWPVRGKTLTKFGQKMPDGTLSDSLQISAPVGTKVKAMAAGTVQKAGETLPGFGKIVVIKHPDGKLSLYAHLKEVSAKTKQSILQGQELGRVGKNGSQPMLLLQVREMSGGKFVPVDPAKFLP